MKHILAFILLTASSFSLVNAQGWQWAKQAGRIQKLFLFVVLSLQNQASNAQSWQSLGTGVDFSVYALEVDTLQDELYVGGWFTTAGGISCNGIAKWDGTDWYSLNGGTNSGGFILTIFYFNNEIYVGGRFDSIGGVAAKNIAKWNYTTWQALGDGLNGDVHSISSFNGQIYAGGSFDSTGSQPLNHIGRWNGISWDSLSSGVGGSIYGMLSFGNNLIVGGNFNRAGTISSAGSIAQWNGTSWNTMGIGFNNNVFNFYNFNSELYVCGRFTSSSPPISKYIAKWDGSTWHNVSYPNTLGSLDPRIDDLIEFNGQLHIIGNFTSPRCVARYDGTIIDSLEHGLSGAGSCFQIFRGELIVGGIFNFAGFNVPNTNSLARWVLNTDISEQEKDQQILYIHSAGNSQIIRIPFINNKAISRLEIFDCQGKLVKEILLKGDNNIDLSDISQGIYIYRVKNNNGPASTGKVLVY